MVGGGGACMAWGMCDKGCVAGGHWGHTWLGGDMHSRGWHVWQGACVVGETATAADGTHPTGMHSCWY